MRLFYRITAYALSLLGVLHTVLTPLFYDRLSPDALWFAGTGLALVFLGLLNLVAERTWQAWAIHICIAANVVACIYGILIVIALPEIQAYVAAIIFIAIVIASILAQQNVRRIER
ncbi:MAG: hypothetical protein JW850_10835 [Thermoflexales bacterium]|nr:hypothetical protein [Thermoflexales bacterium]